MKPAQLILPLKAHTETVRPVNTKMNILELFHFLSFLTDFVTNLAPLCLRGKLWLSYLNSLIPDT